MDLNQDQIKRLEEVVKSRYPIVRAALTTIGWFSFVCIVNGLEYVYNTPLNHDQQHYVVHGKAIKEEPDVEPQPQEEERRPQETSLTPRQWATYRLIKHNSLVEHRKTSQREIYEQVDGYVWNDEDSTHDHCPAIWNDIKDNNLSFEHQHLIISDKFEYWIGSKRECQEFLKKLWNDIAPRLHRYWQYVKLLGYDGHGRLYDKNLNPVDGDNSFFSSFNNYDIEMQKEAE